MNLPPLSTETASRQPSSIESAWPSYLPPNLFRDFIKSFLLALNDRSFGMATVEIRQKMRFYVLLDAKTLKMQCYSQCSVNFEKTTPETSIVAFWLDSSGEMTLDFTSIDRGFLLAAGGLSFTACKVLKVASLILASSAYDEERPAESLTERLFDCKMLQEFSKESLASYWKLTHECPLTKEEKEGLLGIVYCYHEGDHQTPADVSALKVGQVVAIARSNGFPTIATVESSTDTHVLFAVDRKWSGTWKVSVKNIPRAELARFVIAVWH